MRKIAAIALAFTLALAPIQNAWAAIALVASSNGVTGGNVPVVSGKDWSTATLGVACVVTDVSSGSGQTVSFTAGSTGTWTRANRQVINASQIEEWYVLPTSAASGTSISYSGNFSKLFVAAFSGTATSSVTDGAATSATSPFSTTIQPGSITPSQNGDLLYSCLGLDAGGGSDAINSSFTLIDDSATGGCCYGGAHAYYVQPTAGAINPTWSGFSSTTSGASMQAFKNNSGGGGGSSTVPLRGLLGVGQ